MNVLYGRWLFALKRTNARSCDDGRVFGDLSLALTTFLALGAAAQSPRNPPVDTTQRSRAATTPAEDVLRAVIQHIEWAPEDRIAAHPRLDPTLLEDLRAVLGDRLSPLVSSPGYLIADNVVTIDDVEVKGDTAFVTVTYGPVPARPLVECGTKITLVLHRADKWGRRRQSLGEMRVRRQACVDRRGGRASRSVQARDE